MEYSAITKIKKRDGRVVNFDKKKIVEAIFKAASSVGGKDRASAEELAGRVVAVIDYQHDGKSTPSVEGIQDIVERVLIKAGHVKTAKAYILYRQQQKKVREMKSAVLDAQNIINEYLDQAHWNVNENSNEAYSFSGLMLHTAGKVISAYTLTEIYPEYVSAAHKDGRLHIHDLTHGFIGYCAGWSLKNLLLMGFGGIQNKVDAKPAKHMDVVISQMVNYMGCLQMEFAGAQAFSSVDTLLAPFARADNMNYEEVKQTMQKLVFSLNIPSRWGSQYPFTNLTFDWVVPKDMAGEKAIVGGKLLDTTYSDYQKEMDMINKAFLEVMLEGDANGRIFTFPIPTYNITRDFDWDSPNAKVLFKVTSKYGTPYFQNYVGSNLDPSSIRAMCCRLNINQKEIMKRPGSMWGPGDSTGSIGVVTINMNRVGYEAESDEDLFEKLRYLMSLARDSLEIKRRIIQKNLDNGLMPYTKRYLGTWKNHFSTIGLCGMNECCMNFLKKDISTPEGKEFTIKVLNFMRDVLQEFQHETGNLYNLEATPAESTSYRFARLDKEAHPDIITSGKDVPFLTNSTNLPVDHTDDILVALEHQNEIQPLYTGGTIFHTFLGERVSDAEATKALVKKIAHNTRLPYFSITPTFSVCNTHGYLKGEQSTCPECGKNTEIYSRVVGYFRPVKNWNAGKQEEFKFRKEYLEEKALSNCVEAVPSKQAKPEEIPVGV